MPKMIFVNLPVADVAASVRFYEAIGCAKNPQFSDEETASMVWSDTIVFMVMTTERFAGFAPRPVADAKASCEVSLCLSADSRAEVDAIADAAAGAGGAVSAREPIDMGWMYNRAFHDPDGHLFEAVWLDAQAAAGGEPAAA